MITREIDSYDITHMTEGNNGFQTREITAYIRLLRRGEFQGLLRFFDESVPLNEINSHGHPILNFPQERLQEIIDTLRLRRNLYLGFLRRNNDDGDEVVSGWLTTTEPIDDLT